MSRNTADFHDARYAATAAKFGLPSKEEQTKQLQDESASYAAAQKPEINYGYLYSGVNQVVRGSQNIKSSGTLKDPFKI